VCGFLKRKCSYLCAFTGKGKGEKDRVNKDRSGGIEREKKESKDLEG